MDRERAFMENIRVRDRYDRKVGFNRVFNVQKEEEELIEFLIDAS